MLNLNLERYGRFLLNGVELDKLRLGTGEAVKAIPVTTSKSNPVQLKPTRVAKNLFDNYEADITPGKTYTISAVLAAGVRKHIYSYDASGTQLRDLVGWSSAVEGYVTQMFTAAEGEVKCVCTSDLDNVSNLMLVEGSTAQPYYPNFSPSTVLPSLRAHGADPVKHKAEKLWGRYVPAVASDTTTYPMVDANGAKFVKDIGLDGTGSDFGYYNEATGVFVKATGASGSLIQPIAYITEPKATTDVCPNQDTKIKVKFRADATTATAALIGARDASSGSDRNSIIIWQNVGANHKMRYDYQSGQVTDGTYTANAWNIAEKDGVHNYLNGEALSDNAAATFQCNYPITIGAVNTAGSVGNPCVADIAEVYIDDVLYMPVRVGTSVYYLDTAMWTLFSSTGTAGADIPCADIIEVNTGDLAYGQYGKNLFDKSTAEVFTGYVSNTGVGYETFIKSGTSERTILFECKPSTTYTVSKVSTDRLRIAEFPSKPVLSSSSVTGSKLLYTDGDKTVATVTTDANCEWLAIQVSNSSLGGNQPTLQDVLDSLQIELGSTATPYEPYHFGIHTDGSDKRYIGSQGVVDLGTLTFVKHSTHGIWSVSTISPDAQRANGITNLLMAGTNYSLTDVQSIGTMADMTYKGHPNDRTFYIRDDDAYDNMTVAEFKSAMSGKYLFYQRTDDTEFIPPISRDIPMLLSADSFVDTQVDSNNKSEAWAVVAFTGADSEGWALYEYQGAISFYKTVSDMIETSSSTPRSNFLCTALDYSNAVWVEDKVGFAVSTLKRLFFRPAGIETLADFKAWLAEKCPIFWYPLATPAVSTHAIDKVELTEKATYTVVGTAELPVTQQATYLGVGA